MNKRNNDVVYDANVDYDSLEQHIYEDAPGHIFYTCPKCGCEYLATFIVEKTVKPCVPIAGINNMAIDERIQQRPDLSIPQASKQV